jgi:hypothetical protein
VRSPSLRICAQLDAHLSCILCAGRGARAGTQLKGALRASLFFGPFYHRKGPVLPRSACCAASRRSAAMPSGLPPWRLARLLVPGQLPKAARRLARLLVPGQLPIVHGRAPVAVGGGQLACRSVQPGSAVCRAAFATYPFEVPAEEGGGFMQLRWFQVRSTDDPGCVSLESFRREVWDRRCYDLRRFVGQLVATLSRVTGV